MIVIKEGSLRTETGKIQVVLFCFFSECVVFVVDEKQVVTGEGVFIGNYGNIDVEIPVAVNIGHGYTRAPVGISGHAGFFGNVFELKISFVEVKLVTGLVVGGKIEIRQSVVVDVASGYAASVVIIEVIQDVEEFVFLQCVFKIDVGG